MTQTDNSESATIYLVDDDPAVRKSLSRSLEMRDYQVVAFASAEEFLEQVDDQPVIGCLLLDVRMPGMSGLELQEVLIERQSTLPIIFITGHGDIPMSVTAIKSGAIEFLEKPYEVDALLRKIDDAIALSRQLQTKRAEQAVVLERFALLTAREVEVMRLLVAGAADASNKVIARQLSISHRTVDDHRARIMAKMQARSVSELVDMAKTCGCYKP